MIPYKINLAQESDIAKMLELQPEDWNDIRPSLQLYLNLNFCRLVKVQYGSQLIGIGANIRYRTSAWLAHIIVHHDFRRRGIGTNIIAWLMRDLKNDNYRTISLIASPLGKPLYERVGFRTISENIWFSRDKKTSLQVTAAKNIMPYELKRKSAILDLDMQATGENREELLEPYLNNAKIFLENEEVKGFYLPGLEEGAIIAYCPKAGIELMKAKYQTVEKANLPVENITGISFLKGHGFKETHRVTRMVLGPHPTYKPQLIYSRMGGNFG